MNDDRTKAIEEAATVAAAWWARQIGGHAKIETGSGMVNMVLLRNAGPPAPKDEATRFEEALHAKLVEQLERHGKAYLSVDYHPDGLLRQVVSEVGTRAQFPIKTSMSIRPGDVTVAAGYHAPNLRLLGEVVWQVSAFRPALCRGDTDRWATFYRGTDEAEARRMFALAVSVLPPGGTTTDRQFNPERCNVQLKRDGSDVGAEQTARAA